MIEAENRKIDKITKKKQRRNLKKKKIKIYAKRWKITMKTKTTHN